MEAVAEVLAAVDRHVLDRHGEAKAREARQQPPDADLDLEARQVGAPVKVKVPASLARKLAGLFITDAQAGGIADTQPISPDGSLLYLPQSNGLAVMNTATMTTSQVLLYGRNVTDVWVSGDGTHLYAVVDGKLAILADGKPPLELNLSAGGFLSSVHG